MVWVVAYTYRDRGYLWGNKHATFIVGGWRDCVRRREAAKRTALLRVQAGFAPFPTKLHTSLSHAPNIIT